MRIIQILSFQVSCTANLKNIIQLHKKLSSETKCGNGWYAIYHSLSKRNKQLIEFQDLNLEKHVEVSV